MVEVGAEYHIFVGVLALDFHYHIVEIELLMNLSLKLGYRIGMHLIATFFWRSLR